MMRTVLLSLLALVLPVAGISGTVTYTSSTSFFTALGANPFTTETYEGLTLNSVIANGSTVDNLTYTGFPRQGGRIDNSFNRIGNQSLAVSGTTNFFLPSEGFTVTFPGTVFATGIFFNVGPSSANTLQIITSAGTAGNGTTYDTSTLYFVGLISTSSFTSAAISGTGGSTTGYNVDNLTYANATAAVPEPSSLALLALGIAGLAGWRGVRSRACRVEGMTS